MFLGVSAKLFHMAKLSEDERRSIGGRVQMRRQEKFGTKSEAYRSAGVNAATWDRIEEGLAVREDRLIAALKTLWPESGGDWTAVGREEPLGMPVYDGGYDDPQYLAKIESWLFEVESRLQALEAHVSRQGRMEHEQEGGTSDDGKSDDQKSAPTGNVRPLNPKHQRMLEDAQEADWAAYDGEGEGDH